MEVRAYAESDRAGVIGLWKEVFKPTSKHGDPETSLNLKLKHNDGLLFVAVDRNRVVGTAMAGYDGHRGWIYSLASAPDVRKKGVGRALLQHAEKELKARGCLKLNLQVLGNNAVVVGFYEKCGFKVEDRISMGKTLY